MTLDPRLTTRSTFPVTARANFVLACRTCGFRADVSADTRTDAIAQARRFHQHSHVDYDVNEVEYHDHPLFRGQTLRARREPSVIVLEPPHGPSLPDSASSSSSPQPEEPADVLTAPDPVLEPPA